VNAQLSPPVRSTCRSWPNHRRLPRALHAHLRALKGHGFNAAPTPVQLTADDREQLTNIPGDVALPPFPRWVMTETALSSVGCLLRRLHEASVAIRPRVPRPTGTSSAPVDR